MAEPTYHTGPNGELVLDPSTGNAAEPDTGTSGLGAFAEGAGQSLTLGASTWLEKLAGVDPADIRAREEQHPWAHGLGEVTGFAAPLLLSGGAWGLGKVIGEGALEAGGARAAGAALKGGLESTAAGWASTPAIKLIGEAGEGAADLIPGLGKAAEGAGFLTKAAKGLGRGIVSGATQGVIQGGIGDTISEAALDPDFSSESLLASGGHKGLLDNVGSNAERGAIGGAIFGGALGTVGGILSGAKSSKAAGKVVDWIANKETDAFKNILNVSGESKIPLDPLDTKPLPPHDPNAGFDSTGTVNSVTNNINNILRVNKPFTEPKPAKTVLPDLTGDLHDINHNMRGITGLVADDIQPGAADIVYQRYADHLKIGDPQTGAAPLKPTLEYLNSVQGDITDALDRGDLSPAAKNRLNKLSARIGDMHDGILAKNVPQNIPEEPISPEAQAYVDAVKSPGFQKLLVNDIADPAAVSSMLTDPDRVGAKAPISNVVNKALLLHSTGTGKVDEVNVMRTKKAAQKANDDMQKYLIDQSEAGQEGSDTSATPEYANLAANLNNSEAAYRRASRGETVPTPEHARALQETAEANYYLTNHANDIHNHIDAADIYNSKLLDHQQAISDWEARKNSSDVDNLFKQYPNLVRQLGKQGLAGQFTSPDQLAEKAIDLQNRGYARLKTLFSQYPKTSEFTIDGSGNQSVEHLFEGFRDRVQASMNALRESNPTQAAQMEPLVAKALKRLNEVDTSPKLSKNTDGEVITESPSISINDAVLPVADLWRSADQIGAFDIANVAKDWLPNWVNGEAGKKALYNQMESISVGEAAQKLAKAEKLTRVAKAKAKSLSETVVGPLGSLENLATIEEIFRGGISHGLATKALGVTKRALQPSIDTVLLRHLSEAIQRTPDLTADLSPRDKLVLNSFSDRLGSSNADNASLDDMLNKLPKGLERDSMLKLIEQAKQAPANTDVPVGAVGAVAADKNREVP